MKTNKILLLSFLFLLSFYWSVQLFNKVNAWSGIAVGIITVIYLFKFIIKLINNKEK